MIRPLTIATFLLACGSGLYLYQSKHEVQLLDRTIERTVHETAALREQSRLLAAEWTMLNDPERLRQFSDTYLTLKTITPSQFTSLTDLGNRLPAPIAEAPPPGGDEQEPVTEAVPLSSEPAATAVPPAAVTNEVLPVPPIPATPSAPAGTTLAHLADTRTTASHLAAVDTQPRSVAAEPRQNEQHAVRDEQRAVRVADAHAEVHPPSALPPRPIVLAAPRPMPVSTHVPLSTQASVVAPVPPPPRPTMVAPAGIAASGAAAAGAASPAAAAPGPYSGSLLGMAHGPVPASVPRPTPVNATYNAN